MRLWFVSRFPINLRSAVIYTMENTQITPIKSLAMKKQQLEKYKASIKRKRSGSICKKEKGGFPSVKEEKEDLGTPAPKNKRAQNEELRGKSKKIRPKKISPTISDSDSDDSDSWENLPVRSLLKRKRLA